MAVTNSASGTNVHEHVASDECGSLNEWLAAAPLAAPLCGQVAAMVSIGDLAEHAPLTDGDILGPSEAFRHQLDYFSHTKHVRAMIEKLAAARLLRALGESLAA